MKHNFYTVTACGPVGGKYGFIVLFHPTPEAEPLIIGISTKNGTGNPNEEDGGLYYGYPSAKLAHQFGQMFATDKVAQEDGDHMVSVMFRTQVISSDTTETEAVPADTVAEIPQHIAALAVGEVEEEKRKAATESIPKGRRGRIRPLHETGMD